MMIEQVPWKGHTVDNWLRNTIGSVVELDHAIIISVLALLYLNDNKTQLSSSLSHLLGWKSFSVISIIIQFRKQILQALTYENQNAHDATTNSGIRMSIFHPSQEYNISNFRNYLRYDFSKPDIKPSAIDLIPIDQLPVWTQSSFDGLSFLNPVQSSVFKAAFTRNENLLVCAPTGTGKTNIALLTILHEIEKHLLPNSLQIDSSEFLVVYITPVKALATEITNQFKKSLKSLKICVNEYTGDTSLSSLEAAHSHILIATPEKWDVATRKFEGDSLGSRLSLLIIDEIHFLQDDRGPVIEAIVARTLRQVQQSHKSIRIIGLSATLPNIQEVASFLQVPPSGLFFFGPEYRPVPLGISLLGSLDVSVLPVSNIYHQIFQSNLEIFHSKDKAQVDIICLELLEKLIPRQQSILIFVHSRNETTRFAQLIEKCFSASISKKKHEQVQNRQLHPELQNCLKCGIGIHHAGLSREDRNFVETIFSNGSIQILVCTSTLAWGVNFPAHTVIIKGTEVYSHEMSKFIDIGILDVHQMFGRAGRPQFDSEGDAYLIATSSKLAKYTSSLIVSNAIKSQFNKKFIDYLNSEISLGTITSIKNCLDWAKYTFFSQLHPDYRFETVIEIFVKILIDSHCIEKNFEDDICPTIFGKIGSIFYVSHETIQLFYEKHDSVSTIQEALFLICQAFEFKDIPIRHFKTESLQEMEVRYPVKESFDSPHIKTYYLIQDYFTKHENPKHDFNSNFSTVVENAARVVGCFTEIASSFGNIRTTILSILLEQMMIQGFWIDENFVDKLFAEFSLTKDKFAFNSNWNYLAEQKLFYSLKEMKIKKFELILKVQRKAGIFELPIRSQYFKQREIPSLHFLIADSEEEKLISHKRIQLRSDLQTITIPYEKNLSNSSFLYIFSDAYSGVDLIYRIQDFKNSSQNYIKNPKKQKARKNNSRFFYQPSNSNEKSNQEKKYSNFLYEAPSNSPLQINKTFSSQSDPQASKQLKKTNQIKKESSSKFLYEAPSNSSSQINQISASFQFKQQLSSKIQIEKPQKTGKEKIQIENDKTHTG